MPIPWSILISLAVIVFALLIKHLFSSVIEEENSFLCIVGAFFIVYAVAAVAINAVNHSA